MQATYYPLLRSTFLSLSLSLPQYLSLNFLGAPFPVACNRPTLGRVVEAEGTGAHELLGVRMSDQLHCAKHLLLRQQATGVGH